MERKFIVAETNTAAQSKCSSKGQGRYGMIRFDDRQLVRKHGGLGLQDYWLDCWEADPYGSRYVLMPDTDLKNTTHRKYRRQLKDLNLFMFETRRSDTGHQLWLLNRHGSRSLVSCTRDDVPSAENASVMSEDADQNITHDAVVSANDDSIGVTKARLRSQKGSQNASLSSHYLFNTLSIGVRESFEKYVKDNWLTPIRSMEAFLSDPVYLQEWLGKFYASPAGRAAKLEASIAKYDWENDPRLMDWLVASNECGYVWIHENEAEREERNAFYLWATKTNAYQGRIE